MATPSSPIQSNGKPPIVVIGVEQEWTARSLESVLGPHGFAVVRAYSGAQTIDLAEIATPDLVLVDSRLPDMDGLDVCLALRDQRRIGANVPVVITTSGPVPRDFLRAAYGAGVWSVWEQPLDGELLVLRLRTWVSAKRVVDDAERASMVDVESGLYTFSGLHRRAREVMTDAARRHTPVSCIAIAPILTRTGTYIDETPVPARVSAEIARLIAGSARGSDVVGRTGAAEFAIVVPMTTGADAVEMVERLRDRVAAMPPVLADGRSARIALRAGLVTIADPGADLRDASDLLVRASTALRYAQSARDPGIRSFDEVPASFV